MTVGGPYSALKVFHHRDHIDQLRAGQVPIPLQVQLHISDLCQHDCPWCSWRWTGHTTNELWNEGAELSTFGTNNPKRMIPVAKVLEILDDCAEMGVKAIQYTGGGEPTVHPQHREIFQATLDRGLEMALVSNGTIFRGGNDQVPSTIELLLQAQWVRFSLDAGTRETYAATRRIKPEFFEQFQRNVAALTAARARLEVRPRVVIGVGFVVNQDNWREVVEAARIARELGVDNFRISAVFQPQDAAYFADFHAESAALCRAAEQLSTPAFQVINRFSARLEDLRIRHPDYDFCGYQYLQTIISASLGVWRCCNTAYNPLGALGSLKDQRFRDLWQSPELRDKLTGFTARGCPRCMFNTINQCILYAIGDKAEHVNFV